MSIDEEKLMAFADGELEGEEYAEVARALALDPGLREQLEAQRRLRAALTGHYGPVAAEPVPDRLLAMLSAEAPAGVASLDAARERRLRERPAWRAYGTIAASLAVGLLAGQLIPFRSAGPIGVEDGALVADGRLAAALETQLASAPDPRAETRIGITFADRQGRTCRTFAGAAVSGLACREGEKWALVMTAAGEEQPTQYRQAGSSLVLESAQEMMAGEPLDAAAEQAAREAGWKITRAGD